MRRVKIFKSVSSVQLEQQINSWLAENDGRVEILNAQLALDSNATNKYIYIVYYSYR
jgi:hypothetical protein